MNKQTAKRIVLAQIASDGGKYVHKVRWAEKYWIYDNTEAYIQCKAEADALCRVLNSVPEKMKDAASKAHKAGYAVKDKLLQQACEIVARHHDSDIHFFVTKDKEGIAEYIVYFDIKIEGTRWQASFHSFGDFWNKWAKSTVSSVGHWDHKSSQETCIQLARIL